MNKKDTFLTANVAFQEPIDKLYTYFVPERLKNLVAVGKRVVVPVRDRFTTAYIIELGNTTNISKLKDILDVLDEEPIIDENMMALARWMSAYYFCPLGVVLKSILPGGINVGEIKIVRTVKSLSYNLAMASLDEKATTQREILEKLYQHGSLTWNQLIKLFEGKSIYSSLQSLERMGLIEISRQLKKPQVQKRLLKAVSLNFDKNELEKVISEMKNPTEKKINLLRRIAFSGDDVFVSDFAEEDNKIYATIRALEKAGLIKSYKKRYLRLPYTGSVLPFNKPVALTEEQQKVISDIEPLLGKGEFSAHLLHGVTGSGKTEVYLQLIEKVIKLNQQAIVLVPEISLTPQFIRWFRGRFGDNIALLHSKLSTGERYDEFMRIKRGEVSIALGARSAVFAPFPRLGLIVVDEEHDTSYKQDTMPHYNGRDVAVMRAKLAKCPVILGSATPSVESYYNAEQGKYIYHRMVKRIIDRPMPPIKVIDLRAEVRKDKKLKGSFSHILINAIFENMDRGGQTLIYINRRGFHTFAMCNFCGWIARCENCSVSLTYHSKGDVMRCHYCGYSEKTFRECKKCGKELEFYGSGTQRVEEELADLFSQARISRLDSDAVSRKHSQEAILTALAEGKIDILVGTKMITKGHDIPGVTLVGVLSADDVIGMPDFRSGERSFQTLIQVAGRAGRGSDPGKVYIQTFDPAHYSIIHARDYNYEGFYQREMSFRKVFKYPPYYRVVNLIISHTKLRQSADMAIRIQRALQNIQDPEVEILGPAQAPLFKLKKNYRWQIMLRSKSVEALHRFTKRAYLMSKHMKVKMLIDVDPINLF